MASRGFVLLALCSCSTSAGTDVSADGPVAYEASADRLEIPADTAADASARDVAREDDPGDASTGPDAAPEAGADAVRPSCIQDSELHFSAPVPLFVRGGRLSRAMTATNDGRLAIAAGWWGRGGTYYLGSTDGGRTFQPAKLLEPVANDNLEIALGPRHVYVTSALFGLAASVVLWRGPTDGSDPGPSETIQFGPWDTYLGVPVAAADGRVTMFLANGSLAANADEGTLVSSAAEPQGVFTQPRKLFWPGVGVAGHYHANGKLYIAYALEGQPPWMELRWSADNGATFSAPIVRSTTGGQVWTPKLYELTTGDLVAIGLDGYLGSPPARTVAVRFDVARGVFDPAVVVDEGSIVCWDSARLGNGRIYVVGTFGELGEPGVSKLRFSDDDGRTWSTSRPIPVMERDDLCPMLAASRDELYLLWSHGDALALARAGGPGACAATLP
jgi:hypothetical protein